MLEREIEAYLVRRVAQRGGKAYKFVSPGNAGVPDRLVVLPGGKVFFVECKAPGEKPRPLQVAQISKLERLGCQVFVIDSKESVDTIIALC